MAGDWIPMRLDLAEDPAVIAIATATGLDEDTIVGKLLRLWGWANKQLRDGDAPGVTLSWIDRHLGVTGFAQAMSDAGWLVIENDRVAFPNFDRWNSKCAKNRILTAIRMRRMRDNKRDESSVTIPSPEKRREEKRVKKKNTPLPPVAKSPKPRKPNPLFDAIAEASGLDPATAGSKIGTATAIIAKAEPPYTPEEVHSFALRFWEFCPWAQKDNRTRPTPHEIASNIGLVRSGPGKVQPPLPGTNGRQADYATRTALHAAGLEE